MTLFHFDNGLLFQDFPLRLRALDGDLAKLRVGASEVADFVQPANLVCPPVDVPVSELLENERDPGERLNQPTASYEDSKQTCEHNYGDADQGDGIPIVAEPIDFRVRLSYESFIAIPRGVERSHGRYDPCMQFLGHCVETIHDRVTGSRSLHRIGLGHFLAQFIVLRESPLDFLERGGDLGAFQLVRGSLGRVCVSRQPVGEFLCIPETVIMAILASGRGEVGQELLHFNQVDFDLFLQTDEVDSEPRRLLLPVPL
ncbi:MAG: hypothetical protein WAK03_03630 [Methylocystis sp.]